ncbi:hypothetical protein PXK30_20995 [Phaeobacter gallaeciensis]|uniref:hypothetical protein n=1 Tax=Phaeobacter gallaeciensis TaxID=60890 RepID=UPI00237F8D86|nr:hypothetical protein [Phaeobacter gallaeciensis]MDE4306125.1 hypothetical protein [Phaeobacter gallaeciensis]MDE4310547.1 hypothetical protein [Phaeobacter gallaeciensis]MDE4315007.1 hypothetical protein [Phaeobacter gallaeciensis]MDE4319516.1 hypothetical protein [Phaeobacter gallaeciensis]MDE4323896.1 hypothetical protein [Phaeobacter gallaeciensis]
MKRLMCALFCKIAENSVHGRNMRTSFAFSKQISLLQRGKAEVLEALGQTENFSALLFMSYIIVTGRGPVLQSPFFIGDGAHFSESSDSETPFI